MGTSTAVRALVEAARRTRMLDATMLKRIAAAAETAGVVDTGTLGRFLAGPHGPGGQLAGRLGALLAPPGLAFAEWRPHARLLDGLAGQAWLADDPGGQLSLLRVLPAASLVGEADEQDPQEAQRRFLRQIEVSRQLDHPHLVRFLGNGQTPSGDLWFAVEYIESGDLGDLLRLQGGRLPETQVLSFGAQIAGALAELQRLSLVHRAVSPSAILVAADGNTKLGNLFLARSGASSDDFTVVTTSLSGSDGSSWMPPEAVQGEVGWDIRADVYSLGCVLYSCLAGRPPFIGAVHEVMHGHASQQPPDLRQFSPNLDGTTADAITTCLAKTPEKRPLPADLRDTLATIRRRLVGRAEATDSRHRSGPLRLPVTTRTPLPGMMQKRRQISLAGDFCDVPMNEVLQTLSRVKASGVLRLTDPDNSVHGLAVVDGEVIALVPGEPELAELAERLADVPGLDLPRLRTCLASKDPAAERIENLVAGNLIAREALDDVLTSQLFDAITRRFLDTTGSFAFAGDDDAGSEAVAPALIAARRHPLKINGNHLLMEAARQLDVWTALQRSLPGQWAIPRLDPLKAAAAKAEFTWWPERSVFASIDGATPLCDVLALANATPYAALRLVADLVERGEVSFLTGKELLARSNELCNSGRMQAAEPFARAALATLPADPPASLLFARCLAAIEPDAAEDTLFASVIASDPGKVGTSTLTPTPGSKLEGRLEDAFAGEWLALLSTADGSGTALHCFSAEEVQLGKLAKPPVLISLRKYPEMTYLAESQQISRGHCSLSLRPGSARLKDLGAANGTWLNGERLAANAESLLTPGRDHLLMVANVVQLNLRVVTMAGANLPALPDPVLRPPASQFAALAIERVANRPELGYALVNHRLAVGGPGSELCLTGLPPGPHLILGRCSGRWLWCPAQGFRAWHPVILGHRIDAGNMAFTATAGDHRFYH